MKRALQLLFVASILCASSAYAQQIAPVIAVDNPPNTAAQQAKHYVILVSLDGFRYDYPAKYGAPHIGSMAKDGASAPDGMLPSYPSLTFPNHLTLVTGLYPEHHGIVANSFYDATRNDTYVYTQSRTNGDGTWYRGTPLWSLAEQQGMRSACFFWPGSEAEIAGKRPSYYLKFDNKFDDKKRVEQVLAWLALPPEQRPHFITLYYSNVDHEGHEHGPDSDEVRAAVHHVDDMIGDLQAGIAASKLPVDLIVVADHGMIGLQGDPIDLSTFANLNGVHTEGSFIYAKDDAQTARIYSEFKAHPDPRFSVYRRAEMPKELHYDEDPREGDPVIVPNGPYNIISKPLTKPSTLHGMHGYDPNKMPEMKAIFFAEGPDIKPGTQLKTFANTSIYPFIVGLLDLSPPHIDGSISKVQPALADIPGHVYQVADDVTAPVLLKHHGANYSKAAKDAKVTGVVVVGFIVEKDGTPSNVHVIRGIGYGLDEEAVKAVSQYRFKPSSRSGSPVRVEVNVESNFQLF